MKTNNIESSLVNFVIIYTIIVIVSILILSVNTFYWADDYNFMLDLEKNGVFQNCINYYNNWDGRFLSIGAILQGFLLNNFKIEIITLIWGVCFLTSCFLSVLIVKQELRLKINLKITFFFGLIMICSTWLGSYDHVHQTIYWGTGGIYSFDLMIGFLWVIFYTNLTKAKTEKKHLFILFILTILTAASTHNLTIGLITLIIVNIIIGFLENDNKNVKLNLLVLFFLIAGMLIMILAPGNSIRMAEIPNSSIEKKTFFELINNFYIVLKIYFIKSLLLIFLTVLSAFAFRYILYSSYNYSFEKIKTINLSNFFINFKWLLVAISTISPFMIMPQLATERTEIYFMSFLVIFILSVLLRFNIKYINNKSTLKLLFSGLIIFVLLTLTFIFSIYNLNKGFTLKEKMLERDCLLKKSSGKIVTIKRMSYKLISPCYKFFDLLVNDNEDDFIKIGHEKFYNLKGLNVEYSSEFDRLEGKVIMSLNNEWYIIKEGQRWRVMSEESSTDYLNSLHNGQENVIKNVSLYVLNKFPIVGEVLPQLEYVIDKEISKKNNSTIQVDSSLEGKVVMSKTGDWFVIKDGKRWMAMSEPATTDYLNSMRNGQNNVIRDVDPKTLEQFPIVGEILPGVNFDEK